MSLQQPGERFLKSYELHEQIGAGGFGVVYRAFQPLLKRPVAIKAILPEYANRPDFIRRFEVEAELVARLEHPHIIPLYDYWREPDGAYLVMRWLAGGSLRHALEESLWDTTRISRLVDEITAALMVAHRHGVVHRDIKPDNILLDEDGNAYLADFGIAKDLGSVEITQGGVIGSPSYFAPEQIRSEVVTGKTDQYSLGVMMFEILTGTRPFADSTLSEILYKHLNEPLPSLQDYRPDLSSALNNVIQRATAKNPDERFEDVLQFSAAFREALTVSSTKHIPTATEPMDTLLSELIVDVRTTVEGPPPANPYKGLHSFQEADAVDFFGREALIRRLLERLSETGEGARFLSVVGPSGSGKSSVVKAGLIPRLRQGALPHSDQWFIAQMVPGERPLEELEIALLRIAVNPPSSLLEQLKQDRRGLLRAVRRILPDDQSELVLVIDQFEEVFTQGSDLAVQTHFLESLYSAATDPTSQIRILVTLRADFYDRPLQFREFGELTRTRMESVLPLSADELRQSILTPAERVGVTLEPTLVAAIIRDVDDQPGSLPLLQYALTELFERQQERRLTLAAYEEIGGIAGALGRRAEELYQAGSAASQEVTRQLFLRLVTLGEGSEDTRRRVRLSELITATSADTLNSVIDAYGRARLLTFDRDPITRSPTVDIAHEALLRTWQRLRGWIEDSREDVRTQRKLSSAAHDWADASFDPSFLASGARLVQFEEWAAGTSLVMNEEESKFLARSVEERETQRKLEDARQELERKLALQSRNRLRWLVAVMAVFLVVALGLSAFALDRQKEAETQSFIAADNAATATNAQGAAEQQSALAQTQAAIADRNAQQAQALALAANSQLVLNSDDTDLALVLALEANQLANQPSSDIQRALTAAAYAPGTRFLMQGHTLPVTNIAISPDGKLALSSGGDETNPSTKGELILWDLTTGKAIRRFEGHQDKVLGVAFDPQGRTAISGDYNGVLILWDVATGKSIRRFHDPTDVITRVMFSPDGHTVVTAGGATVRDIQVWDVATGEIVHRLTGHSAQIISIAYSPDGRYIASGALNGEVILWDANTGTEVRRFVGHTDSVNSLAFSPDSQTLLSGGTDIGMVLWNVETGAESRRILTGIVYAVAFSPDGKTVLSGLGTGTSGTLTLWDAATGAEIRRYVGHTSSISSVAFSPDGRTILSGSLDRSLRLWYVNSGAEAQRIQRSDGVESVALSPDGQFALSGARDGSVSLTNLTTGAEIHSFKGHRDIVRSVAFTPDGRTGVSGSLDGSVIVWNLVTGKQIRQFKGHQYPVISIAISPDGQTVLSTSFDLSGNTSNGELILWNLNTDEIIRRLDTPILNAVFSAEGQTALISVPGVQQNDAEIWDVQTGQIVKTFQLGADPAWGLAFSPDGAYALLGLGDSTIRLWNVAASEEVLRFIGHTDLVNSVAFSPDGHTTLSASNDHSLILWDSATGAQIYRFVGHAGAVRSVVFSQDGQYALSGSRDTTVRLWRIFPSRDDLVQWVHANRYVRDLTCSERQQYEIRPLCPTPTASPTGTG